MEKIAAHFLGDVSLSLTSLRAITEKIEATSSKQNEGVNNMGSDAEDMALKDEKFIVKTLSRNTARKKALSVQYSSKLTAFQITRVSSHIGTSPRRFARRWMNTWR